MFGKEDPPTRHLSSRPLELEFPAEDQPPTADEN